MTDQVADPKKDLVQAQRTASVIEVQRHMNYGGLKKNEACEKAGITTNQFDYWTTQLPGDIGQIRDLIFQMERQELLLWLGFKQAGTTELIRQILDKIKDGYEINDPKKFMELLTDAQDRIDQLKGEHQADMGSEQEAQEFLQKGPQREEAESMMKSRHIEEETTTINVNPQQDGSVDITVTKPPDTIDGEFTEASSDLSE